MRDYGQIFISSFQDYWGYFKNYILSPSWGNFFYWLVGISIVVWGLEVLVPWRSEQKAFRKDFWLDAFYMFFNIFLFSLIGYYAVANVFSVAFNDFLYYTFGIKNLVAVEIQQWPQWAQLLLLFVLRDFIQWCTHILLHRVPLLWQFHKVHHSVEEMGFAAHLRYHWMENIVYNTIQYIPLGMIGFGLDSYLLVYLFATAIGHLNHANIYLPLGPFKYILNNPQMHIWHHAKDLPEDRRYGVNFGLTLSIWDYIFKTAYIPYNGRDIKLGFSNLKKFPKSFWKQVIYPIGKKD